MRPDSWRRDLFRALALFAMSLVVAVLVILFTSLNDAPPTETTEDQRFGHLTNGHG